MSPDELPAMFDALEKKCVTASPAAVMAMAHRFERYLKQVVLIRFAHPPGTFTPSPRYTGSPGLMTGALRSSVRSAQGAIGAVSTASVAPHVFYAGIQEYGRPQGMTAHSIFRPMTWYNEGRWWSKYHVVAPPRPYMRPAIARCIASGVLSRAAIAAFMLKMWG